MTEEQNLSPEKVIGRNEPCPCGSGKKYKRCHGVGAAPKVTPPKAKAAPAMPGGGAVPPGFDPSQMDPAMMAQVTQTLQRLPRSQMQKLQSIMQRAMAGKDVTREAQEFERTLPPDVVQMFRGFAMQQGMAANMAANQAPAIETSAAPAAELPSTTDEAAEIVEKAAAEGRISREEAEALLGRPLRGPSS